MRRRTEFSFTITILTAFALLFIVAVGLVILGYRQTGARAAVESAEQSMTLAAQAADANIRAMVHPVATLVATLPSFMQDDDLAGPDEQHPLASILAANQTVQTVSLGNRDGTLEQMLRADSALPPDLPKPQEGEAYILREARAGAAMETWRFLTPDGHVRTVEVPARHDFDPQQTQWYLQATTDSVHTSTLYDLPLLGRPGISLSKRVSRSDEVLAVDITLSALASFLGQQRPSIGSQIFLFTDEGILLAHNRPELAVVRIDENRSTWTTLAASHDPLLREVWALHASGRLMPGEMIGINRPEGRLLAHLTLARDLAGPHVYVGVVAPLSDFSGIVDAAVRDGTLLSAVALLVGLAAIGLLAWRITRPLDALATEAQTIRRLQLDGPVSVISRITEIARLSESMDSMKSGLRLFRQYVPRDLVSQLMSQGAEARVGGEKRHITVMFSDVINFTTLSEGVDPEELMRITSAYFQAVTDELLRHRATIDKYIGDAVMALWNAPSANPQHALHACQAAVAVRDLTDQLCDTFDARGWPRLRTRFGIHTGDAIVGNVGSTDRMSYTAIGAMVNLASRLEGMNKFYGTRILISEQTRLAAGAGIVTRPVDLAVAKGANTPVEIHELLRVNTSNRPRVEPDGLAWCEMIRAYRAGRFRQAADALACVGDPHHDPLIALYAQRLQRLREQPPPPGWSPVNLMTTK